MLLLKKYGQLNTIKFTTINRWKQITLINLKGKIDKNATCKNYLHYLLESTELEEGNS